MIPFVGFTRTAIKDLDCEASGSDCVDRCNHVIFQDWNDEGDSNELDDDADFGENNIISSAITMIDGEEVC